MKYWYLIIIIAVLGCEKTISIRPEIQSPKLVVDGSIENGHPPLIILSRSLNYFSNINADILINSIVDNAKVTLSNGTKTVTLRKYIRNLGGAYKLSYYTTDSSNPAAIILGQPGKSYSLTIDYDGQQYHAKTVIPVIDRIIDSLWWNPAPKNDDTTKVVLMGRFTDPPGFGDYIRYFTRVNDGPYLAGFNSVSDDQVIDGSTYDFQVDQGVDRNGMPDREDYGYFRRGDTVTVKFANIDKSSYDFWRTLEFSYQSIGNPFSSPTTVMSNVSNGALGVFCGYGSQFKTLVIPK